MRPTDVICCFTGTIMKGTKDMKIAMSQAIGPETVTHGIHQAISVCWRMLPAERKNVAAVEAEIRRIVDRELKALREDAKAFGIPEREQ